MVDSCGNTQNVCHNQLQNTASSYVEKKDAKGRLPKLRSLVKSIVSKFFKREQSNFSHEITKKINDLNIENFPSSSIVRRISKISLFSSQTTGTGLTALYSPRHSSTGGAKKIIKTSDPDISKLLRARNPNDEWERVEISEGVFEYILKPSKNPSPNQSTNTLASDEEWFDGFRDKTIFFLS